MSRLNALLLSSVLISFYVNVAHTSLNPDGLTLTNETEPEFLERLLSGYSKHIRPMPNGPKKPLKVEINFFVNSIASINVMDMDYSLDLFLRQRWTDPRLKYKGLNSTLSLSYLKSQLWIPDLFIRNSKMAFVHKVTTPNYLIWLEPSGRITFSQKITIKAACQMDLQFFPMDTQRCALSIGSYGYPVHKLLFIWWINGKPITIRHTLDLSEFDSPKTSTGNCTKTYKATGAFTCLYVLFTFSRKFGYYIVHTYIPSMLIVSICWVSFWIDAAAVPARISLGLLSILSLLTQASSTLAKLPRVSYIKAIDVWLFTCLAFVVLSLMEFAVINILVRFENERKAKEELRKAMRDDILLMAGNMAGMVKKKPPANDENLNDQESKPLKAPAIPRMLQAGDDRNSRKARFNKICKSQNVDTLFVMLYPLSFIVFNIWYWSFYLCQREYLKKAVT